MTLSFCAYEDVSGEILREEDLIVRGAHCLTVQDCEALPPSVSLQRVPPCFPSVQVRVFFPSPQVLEQSDQGDQLAGTGHSCVLQDWLLDPEHCAPPFAGAGFVQVRVWVPPPQDLEHSFQSDQPPAMSWRTLTESAVLTGLFADTLSMANALNVCSPDKSPETEKE